VSGETYAGYIQKHIFDPLEMRHSYASKSDAQKDGLAVGYRTWFSFPFPVPDWPVDMGSLPSGHLISCAEDMAHYLVAQLNGGKYANIQVLSRAGLDEMHRGVKELKLGPFSGGLYGMGWFDIDLGAEKTYSHGGNVPDFSAFMALIPGLNKAVILLMNSDPCGLPPITEELGLGVTALLAGQQPAPVKLDFIRWIIRLLPLIPVVQIAGAVTTLLMLRRWDRNPTLRPGSHKWSKHIVLPLIPSLSMAGILAYLQSSRTIRFLDLFMPDLAWIARVCGGFAAVWAVIRTGLVLKSMKKPRL
jgi:hypothetical protein